MQVRNKRCPDDPAHTYQVIEESPYFYIAKHETWSVYAGPIAISKCDYEPVPEVWLNITGQFDASGTTLHHSGEDLWVALPANCRLRKVKGNALAICGIKEAFVIERKEPQ